MSALPPDAGEAQRAASDPGASVWVAANAGSGKTKVLVDRVLRLLLGGTPASRILCITYTKAAAAEMQNRLFRESGRWSVVDDAALQSSLAALDGRPPSEARQRQARGLFTHLLEESPALRVQTIHSFCQSVLARFPLEAGLPPHFSVLDERSGEELLAEARLRLFAAATDPDEATTQALSYFIEDMAEGRFNDLIRTLAQGRRKFNRMFEGMGGLPAVHRAIGRTLGITPGETAETLIARHFRYSEEERAELIEATARLLEHSSAHEQSVNAGTSIRSFQMAKITPRSVESLVDALSTKNRSNIRTQWCLASFRKAFPPLAATLDREYDRLCAYFEAAKALDTAERSRHLATLADALFRQYETLKRQRSVLDYDDLILRTRRLLCSGEIIAWVLYKLDGGIDHLLLDEAQDTSPDQWEITEALAREFYAGLGARDERRTLFVVGDRKQSIYRFQGAEPGQFGKWEEYFREKALAAQADFTRIELSISFRSTQAVLDAVDATFSPLAETGRFTLAPGERHRAYRLGEAGHVECWPLLKLPEKDKTALWNRTGITDFINDSKFLLAERIANEIADWFTESRRFASNGKLVKPGDILILVRNRGGIDRAIGHALRSRKIPVAGLDRIALKEDMAVKDLIALGAFVLLPDDDLNLACLLKSPLLGWDEERLFKLAHERGKSSLWQRLRLAAKLDSPQQETLETLDRWITLSQRHPSPFEFYSTILHGENGLARLAGRLGDGARESVHSFLEQARVYGESHLPSLQSFLHWLEQSRSQLKRDMEHGGDAVRIMTVHGAKGLEAPIVFLPQMYRSQRPGGIRLASVGLEERELVLPLLKKNQETPFFVDLRNSQKEADEEEELRLLYVAMTRARDELYICGIEKNANAAGEWYERIYAGLESLPETERIKEEGGTRLRYAPKAAPMPLEKRVARADSDAPPPLASLFSRPPPPEQPFSPIFSPSRLLDDDQRPKASPTSRKMRSSPLSAVDRGILLHRLFEVLSAVADEKRETLARNLIAAKAPELSPGQADLLVTEVLCVMRDSRFSAVFSEHALTEVPISGRLDHGIPAIAWDGPITLLGQIDRLVVTATDVWIVDYKTGELPPGDTIEPLYRHQMEAYRALLSDIYPNRRIHCALLYTGEPLLQLLPAALDAPSPEDYLLNDIIP